MKKPATMRVFHLCIALLALTPCWAAVNTPTCQILDQTLRPAWQTSLGIIPETDVERFGKVGMIELNLYADAAYIHNIWQADLDITLTSEMTMLTDSTDMALPDSLLSLYATGTWAWRYTGGSSILLSLSPGIYAATDAIGDGLRIPVTLAGVRRLNDTTSGILGGALRLGFNDWFMPVAGVAWQPSPGFRGEFMLPESRLYWFPNREWTIHSGLEWNNSSFAMKAGPVNHERITLEDFRLTFGSAYTINPGLFARLDMGSVFARRIELDEATGSSATLDTRPDSTVFFRISISGPF